MSAKEWSDRVAALAVDALLTGKVVRKEDFERAVAIISEEIAVRLTLGDYPPAEGESRTDDA
jgi:hypothetical protein